MLNEITPQPFIKWAGGKRQIVDKLKEKLPPSYKRYFEPFVGGGALFFDINPKIAFLNDINEELINTYKDLRYNLVDLMELLDNIDMGIKTETPKEYFYEVRKRYNDKIRNAEYDTEMSALFIFLNKHCFNGLYRVNRKGEFNVPYNGNTGASYERHNLEAVSSSLQTVNLSCTDFEECCKFAEPGDFVYFDSPYAPLKPDSFEAYTKDGFGYEEHLRLSELFKRLNSTGCYLMLSNHNTDLIRTLYQDFNYEVIGVKRMINSNANKRSGEEVIITNY